ncbi:MAG TPA: hemerythrin domain-containing protein, partial [Thermoanaerobaculia bacterium]|nr:hemerythrin domain-containing protein [Thermoanaerobaculia bacterium]
MTTTLPTRLAAEHRDLDALFGTFLGALASGDAASSRFAIAAFDDELRRHTAEEERLVLPAPSERPLLPRDEEDEAARLHRELRLEHVQVRELAAMIRRLLEEKSDLEGARRL